MSKETEHRHIIDFARDPINDEYEEQKWACIKCGEPIYVKTTEWSESTVLLIGFMFGIVGSLVGLAIGHFLA